MNNILTKFTSELQELLSKYDATILRSADRDSNLVLSIKDEDDKFHVFEAEEEISKYHTEFLRLKGPTKDKDAGGER